ncbi:23350_t:CDS:2 [Entrophospora sp. SA101]|nr:12831_t:CDS:2 [Entrophospora sp. SA101]CAJ0760299.1 23350_t:CDS:2 [Entrophospora sp. SA101]CAJ0888905.1 5610_t:CDS:2 [Entrophospora sp. SA101]
MPSNSDSQSLYLPNSKSAGRLPVIFWTHFNKGIEDIVNLNDPIFDSENTIKELKQ